jgi:hypothetical protein
LNMYYRTTDAVTEGADVGTAVTDLTPAETSLAGDLMGDGDDEQGGGLC